jgi:hypothetical protein
MDKIMRELAPRCNSVKQAANVTGPPTHILAPSHTFIERRHCFSCWFSIFLRKCCLFTLVVLKNGIVADKGICISHKMQGFPPEGYEPLPPNSPEDTYHEEFENHSDARSVSTPLLETPE